MKRRVSSPVDYSVDRAKWAGLVEEAGRAAVAPGDEAGLTVLADRALTAESCWTMAAPYPRGLVCRAFARLAFAYGRQTDAALRAQLAAPLMAVAATLEDLLLTEAAAEAAPAPEPETPARRLPYADN